jgi:hexosaminidase
MKRQVRTVALIVASIGFLAALCFAGAPTRAETTDISVIPRPMKAKLTGGHFILKYTTAVYFDSDSTEVRNIADYLAEHLRPATGLALVALQNPQSTPKADCIVLTTRGADEALGVEGYELVVSKDAVYLRAPQPAGLFYGVQTIRQLLGPAVESRKKIAGLSWAIPCLRIEDKPRFQWRGSLLDCCRHFMTKDFVKRYIDLLAYHKMNRFHWHLTEDQGWRIEIKKYPELTEIGAWRNTGGGDLARHDSEYKDSEKKMIYGGYYTQDDIKDVVEYARSRYVMVIPEIELPGHCVAALASYNSLSCTGGPFKVKTTRGIAKDVYCAGEEKVFEFLQDVLSEVVELFPAPYIHIGGDECPKDRWKQCPKCQVRIKTEGLKDEHELQSYFVKRIEEFLLSKNRRLIGWDEILEGGLAPFATVQSWRGMKGAVAAATAGHDTIVSPTTHCYLDYSHSTTSLEKTYSFEPIPQGLTPRQQRHILGGEGNVWTEHILQESADSWVFPRLTALAEVFWSPKGLRDWDDFSARMQVHYKRFDAMGVDYHGKKKAK